MWALEVGRKKQQRTGKNIKEKNQGERKKKGGHHLEVRPRGRGSGEKKGEEEVDKNRREEVLKLARFLRVTQRGGEIGFGVSHVRSTFGRPVGGKHGTMRGKLQQKKKKNCPGTETEGSRRTGRRLSTTDGKRREKETEKKMAREKVIKALEGEIVWD